MAMIRNTSLCFILLIGLSATAWGEPRDPAVLSEARSMKGMVVSVCPHATQVGTEILRAGGNAVDAAIAVEFALAVTWPEAGNIGGGGFMMVHLPGGAEVWCIDYRETAPGAATETMFSPEDGRHTRMIVGVPGTVAGMALAHEEFGSLPWRALVEPAVELAREGFAVTSDYARSTNGVLDRIRAGKNPEEYSELLRVYGKEAADGEPGSWGEGDTVVLPDLAETLDRIADQGRDGFYRGQTAEWIVKEMARGDGIITAADLAGYTAKKRHVIRGKFRGHDVYGPPPPSSGGTCAVQMLHVLERLDLRRHERFSPEALHLLAETMKRAFCDRARFLGDQDFVSVPARLTRPWYARKLAEDIDLRFATPAETLVPAIPITDEAPSTTHFSVIDGAGLAVSNTTTLEASWGARIVVQGAGFLLNNEMGDFNWFPDHTDRSGRIGTEANRIAPGKRMLSSQTPLIVAYKGRPVLLTGSPGGRTIINTSVQMVVNAIEYEMPLDEAMRAPRIHHQWLPDRIQYESFDERITAETIAALEEKGHATAPRGGASYQGDAHSIAIDLDSGEYHGVADWRRGGKAEGL